MVLKPFKVVRSTGGPYRLGTTTPRPRAMAGYYYGNPYAGMYAQPAPAAAPVMGFPVGAGGGPPADQLLQPGSAAHLLGELWALEEADFVAALMRPMTMEFTT